MLLLADENVPLLAITKLKEQNIDIVSISKTAAGISDEKVIEFAKRESRIIITFDKDFGEAIFHANEKVPGIILFRLKLQSPDYIARRITKILQSDLEWGGYFSVVKENSVRQVKLST